ncbi:MAG: GldG family protein [Deltaproteobacteria bacterium]|nr:GldG family protein [Deltaproteobacteria bacterium]
MRQSQNVRHAALMSFQILVVGTLCALLLLLAERHSWRFDLSPTQRFSLAAASLNVAKELRVPVQITAFYNSQEEDQRREMQDTLDLFAKASGKISYRLVDLDRSPALAHKYGVSSVSTGVIESEGKIRLLRLVDEEEITNALLKLTRTQARRVCFITGHGEHSPQDSDERKGYSEIAKSLEKESFETSTLVNVPADGIPTGCTVVVEAGPTKAFLPGEADQLARYIEGGGQLLFLIDPGAPPAAVAFLKRYGVRPGDDVVLDERNRLMGTDSSMLNVPAFNKDVFRTDLDTAVFPLARTILPDDQEGDDQATEGKYKIVALALSSQESWAHVGDGRPPDGNVRFRKDVDHPGPLPVGVMVTARASTSGRLPRLVIYGDSDFASNLSLDWRGNRDVMLSSIALLAEDPTLIAVRHKSQPHGSISPIYLTESQDTVVFWISTVVVPGAFAVGGIVLTAIRRRRASR